MLIFIVFSCVALIAIVIVISSILKEKPGMDDDVVPIAPDEISNDDLIIDSDKKQSNSSLAFTLKGGKDEDKNEGVDIVIQSRDTEPAEPPGTEQVHINPTPSSDNQKSDYQERYEKLESILKEKNSELEESKAALDNERKNRQEFDKVKNILEEELFTVRENAKAIQKELQDYKIEKETYRKQLLELEEKASKLEKELSEKESKETTEPKPTIELKPIRPENNIEQQQTDNNSGSDLTKNSIPENMEKPPGL